MPENKPTGGAAFACAGMLLPNGDIEWGTTGMSLRDYFAGKVLSSNCDAASCEELAKTCYRMADAMLKARVE